MKTVKIDADEIMSAADPVASLCEIFGLDRLDLAQFRKTMESDETYQLVEVNHWPRPEKLWKEIADILESIQQHSEYFFLVWGTEKISGPEK